MSINLLYFVIFSLFIFKMFEPTLKAGGDILVAASIALLWIDGYWRAVFGSFGIYTVAIALAPLFAFAVVREKYQLLAACFLILCLTMYEGYIACFLCLAILAWHARDKKYLILACAIPTVSFAI